MNAVLTIFLFRSAECEEYDEEEGEEEVKETKAAPVKKEESEADR